MPGETITIDRPDILILEGLNVLQPRDLPKDGKAVPFVSDFFDFSIYPRRRRGGAAGLVYRALHAPEGDALPRPALLFPRLCRALRDAEAEAIAHGLWERINLVNLRENILPTRPRADLILRKGADHAIEEVALRRL